MAPEVDAAQDSPEVDAAQDFVIFASFENRHAGEQMLVSLRRRFREKHHKRHATAHVIRGNKDGSLKLTQSRVLTASGFGYTLTRISLSWTVGFIGITSMLRGGKNAVHATFSPSGRRIAFISDRTGVEQVWVMNADGSNQTQLSHSGVREDQLPDWSPDGRRIAFAQGDAGSGRIWVMNADGSNPVQLTSGPGDDFGTAWSPDGRRIAFVRDFANGDRSVWTMNADGSDQQRVMPIPLTEYVPTWARSADHGHGDH